MNRPFPIPMCMLLGLAGLAGWAGAPVARAAELPFPEEYLVDGLFARAEDVTAADLDGDGDLDLLGAASLDDTIAWWENLDGTGTNLTKHVVDSNFRGARSVRAADLDQDGDLDLLGAASVDDDVAWWENLDGSGTNLLKQNIDISFGGARGLDVADMDGDGDPDVLGAAFGDDEVTWWQNDGSGGGWSPHVVRSGFNEANAVRGTDIDRDGDMDIVASASGDDEVAWFEQVPGPASTNWIRHVVQAYTNGEEMVSATTGDLDNDGDEDILAGANEGDFFVWYENIPGVVSNWTARTIYGAADGANTVVAHDLDRDGDLDVVGSSGTDNDLAWFENNVRDSLAWVRYPVDGAFSSARSATAGDLDRDGDLDVLGAAFIGNDISWWRNDVIHRGAFFTKPREVEDDLPGMRTLGRADIDGDGDLDLFGAARESDTVAWWENVGLDTLPWPVTLVDTNFSSTHEAQAGDLDGDGDVDLVAASFADNEIAWWANEGGSGTGWTRRVVATGFSPFAVALHDMNRNGSLDVVAGLLTDRVKWWSNVGGQGTGWVEVTVATGVADPKSIEVADLNRDGWPDVVAALDVDGELVYFPSSNAAGTAFGKVTISSSVTGAFDVAVADFDGDGDPDVAGVGREGHLLGWWENTALGQTWVEHLVDTALTSAVQVTAGDADQDGDADLFAAWRGGGGASWWENDGAGNFSEHLVALYSNAGGLATGDYDQDGDLDLAVSQSDQGLQLYENRGGQLALLTTPLAPDVVTHLSTVVVYAVEAAHRGRAGDQDAELASFRLLFEDKPGNPLQSNEADALMENLKVYLDDGSGLFEASVDPVVFTIDFFSLGGGGIQTINFSDFDPQVQVTSTTARTYFLVIEMTDDAAAHPVGSFTIMHRTDPALDPAGSGEDRTYDLPLVMEGRSNETVLVQPVGEIDLVLNKEVVPESLETGSNLTYTLTISNNSPFQAVSVVVTDDLPNTVTFLPTSSSTNWKLQAGTIVAGLGTLATSEVVTLSVEVEVKTNALFAVVNDAAVSTRSVETNAANNSALALATLPNFDGDGLADFADPDDDNDLMPDTWENFFLLDPLDASDATTNVDTDRLTNLEEYIADRDPRDQEDDLLIEVLEAGGTNLIFLETGTNRLYTLEYNENLSAHPWTNVAGQRDVMGLQMFQPFPDTSGATSRQYRIRVRLP